MSGLVPNLGELAAVLPDDSDGALLITAFDVDALPAVRSALHAVVDSWERTEALSDSDAASSAEQA
jgi:hypothetical protein